MHQQPDRKAFSHERNSDGKDEWLTPPEIIRCLGEFDLDPCSPVDRPWPTAAKHYTQLDDGLCQDWEGRVWCNPPYGNKTRVWMDRIAEHGDGIALIFARTETATFFDSVWPKASAVFFFKGRISFHHVTGAKAQSAGAPSCLVAYGRRNVDAIRSAIEAGKLKGKLITL